MRELMQGCDIIMLGVCTKRKALKKVVVTTSVQSANAIDELIA